MQSNLIKNHIFSLLVLTSVSAAFFNLVDGDDRPATSETAIARPIYEEELQKQNSEEISGSSNLKEPEKMVLKTPIVQEATYELRKGETLSKLLHRAGIDAADAYKAAQSLSHHTDLTKLRPGQAIHLETENIVAPLSTNKPTLKQLALQDTFDSKVVISRLADSFTGVRTNIPTLALTRYIEGSIEDSLYLSAQQAGVPDKTIIDLIRIMSFDVDFQRDIRKGDRFRIYFSRQYAPETQELQEGHILHAELLLQRGHFEASYFKATDGEEAYYNKVGESVRKSLMKTPVDGARLSSGFGKRRHPVLGYTKLHKGLDFAAPRGTPIMAAGDGTVERANRYGSYGNYVRIRHAGSLKTAYAHLSKFGPNIRAGKRVKQGQIIGYIGTTGRSTGPHLHYEVLHSGIQVNPFNLKLPTGRTLKEDELARFQEESEIIFAELEESKAAYTSRWPEDTPLTNHGR